MEVEVSVRLVYMLGEALPASHGAHFTGDAAKASVLQEMMRTVSPRGFWVQERYSAATPLLYTDLNPSSNWN